MTRGHESLDTVGHAASNLPLDTADGFELDELSLSGSESKLNYVVTLLVAFDLETTELELKLLLQRVSLSEIFIEVYNTSLMLVLVLVDLIRLLGLRMDTLGLLTASACLAELLKLLWSMENGTHHDLTGHSEASWIHLAEDNGAARAWHDLNIVACSLEWLLEFKFIELSVVDGLAILRFSIIILNVDVTVAFLGHGEVLGDSRGTLLLKVGSLTFGKLLHGAASHELSNEVSLIVKTLLVAEEYGRGLTVATDAEFSVLYVVRPVKLNIHVVLSWLKVLVLLPYVAILSHLTILVNELLLFSVGVFDFGDNESHVGVVVVDMAIKASVIGLVDGQVMMSAWRADLETNQGKRAQLMARLEEGVLVVVVETAELNPAEVLLEILFAHEEGTIVSIGPSCGLLRLSCPAVRVVTPISFPLEIAPWISELVKPDAVLELIDDFDAANQTV